MKGYYSLIIFWGTIGIVAIYFLESIVKRQRDDLEKFTQSKVNGIVTSMRDINKGYYFLKFKMNKTDSVEIRLHISYFIEVNKIQNGDSAFKEASSKKIFFYKKKDGKYDLCCVFDY